MKKNFFLSLIRPTYLVERRKLHYFLKDKIMFHLNDVFLNFYIA